MNDRPETIRRASSPELDSILGKKFKVLDDGFVRIVDYIGNDVAVAQAARVSYGKGTKSLREDRGLIRYLLRHGHTSPFEMCELKLHVRVPMDHWRQWIRHRTANVNEYSTRYSVAIDAMQRTSANEWRLQSTSSKQGSEGLLETELGESFSKMEGELHSKSRETYDARLAAGIAREQARKDLPLSTYTEAYWKIDLHNLLHFLRLRLDSHAQAEIRAYASIIANEIVARWVPWTWEAFQDYALQSTTITRQEAILIRLLATGDTSSAKQIAANAGWLERGDDGSLRNNRERSETEEKLSMLGFSPPWP